MKVKSLMERKETDKQTDIIRDRQQRRREEENLMMWTHSFGGEKWRNRKDRQNEQSKRCVASR